MAPKATTLTTKGQVTVPVEVRHFLGVQAGDRVRFVIEDGEVKVRTLSADIDSVFGSVKPVRPGLTVDQALKEARATIGEEFALEDRNATRRAARERRR